MRGPISPRAWCSPVGRDSVEPRVFVSNVFVDLLIPYTFLIGGGAGNKKPTTVASRGFLPKSVLDSTMPGGCRRYYYHQKNGAKLSNTAKHGPTIAFSAIGVKG